MGGTPKNRAKPLFIAAAAVAVCAVLVLLLASFARGMTAGRTRKVPAADRQAFYLLFPRSQNTLGRAIIVDGGELAGGGDFGYYDGGIEKRAARNEMSLRPPPSPEASAKYVANLNAEIARWGDATDMRQIAFSVDGTSARLTKHLKNGKIANCTYEIRTDHAPAAVTVRIGL